MRTTKETDMLLRKKHVGHLAMAKDHITKNEYTLINSETVTEKINAFEFGESETLKIKKEYYGRN